MQVIKEIYNLLNKIINMKTIKWNQINILNKNNVENIEEILLKNRWVDKTSLKEYFQPTYEHLHNPFELDGMEVAVSRILKARENKERVIVFWDYDVDWVSSTALLVRFFHEIGIQVSYRLPHRVTDWYWLKPYFFDDLLTNNVSLVITVDCGTRDIEAIRYAKKLNIDLIVTDHHAVPEEISDDILSIINPHKSNCNYCNKDLSWSWVAFKLLHAISLKLFSPKETLNNLKHYIDFAMLGTIADCMPLTWENRTIAYLWLKQIKNSKSHGLKKLIEWNNKDLDWNIIGFHVGPRLNAAGRMDTPYKALRVLLAWEDNLEEALEEIENLNTKRKTSTEKFILKANWSINPNSNVIIYDSNEIEHWILWLIASRLAEAHNKIAIVLRDEWNKLVASLRWPEYIDIVEVLESMKDLFEVFWWHKQAAGFTITKAKYREFKKTIEETVRTKVKLMDTQKIINIDTTIEAKSINKMLLDFIDSLKPFGIWNPKPLFIMEKIKFDRIEYLWKENKHIKLFKNWQNVDYIAFGFGNHYQLLREQQYLSIIFEIEKNVWNWQEKLNINIKDFIL